jgi:hypothetical protein
VIEEDHYDSEYGGRCCVEVEGAQKRTTKNVTTSISTGLSCVAGKWSSELKKEQQRIPVLVLLSFLVEIFSFLWEK